MTTQMTIQLSTEPKSVIKLLNTEERYSLLLSKSKETDLPKHYKSDLEIDKEIMSKYGNSSFLWVLRESGTAMIPLRKGVDPTHITYWAGDVSAKFYLLSLKDLKEITAEKAREMAFEPPCNLNNCSTVAGLVLAVRSVLKQGHDYGWWESQDKGWAEMEAEFAAAKNKVMEDFMFKAIELKHEFDQQLRLSRRA